MSRYGRIAAMEPSFPGISTRGRCAHELHHGLGVGPRLVGEAGEDGAAGAVPGPEREDGQPRSAVGIALREPHAQTGASQAAGGGQRRRVLASKGEHMPRPGAGDRAGRRPPAGDCAGGDCSGSRRAPARERRENQPSHGVETI